MRQSLKFAIGAAIVSTVGAVSAAHADSYVNSQPLLPHQYQSHFGAAYAQAPGAVPIPQAAPRPGYVIRPASQPQPGTNFGVFLRDTRGEGYGPNGQR